MRRVGGIADPVGELIRHINHGAFDTSGISVNNLTLTTVKPRQASIGIRKGANKYIPMYTKDFDLWNEIKKQVHSSDLGVRIRAGEVRWASCGINVGSEIDGKGGSFTRPVLVLHVVGASLAMVIPMSTKLKETAGYVPFEFQGRTTSLCIHQARTISQRRVLSRIGRISDGRLREVKSEFRKFFDLG